MGNLTSQLTRTCNTCKIEKPLSAFLQLSGAHGTSYSNVCAKCRSISKVEKPISTVTEEEGSTEPSGSRIRGKEKIYADVKREQKIHTLKELYRKEDVKKRGLTEEKIDQTNIKETVEKKHREFYIDPKKQTALSGGKVPVSQQQTIARQQTQKLIGTRTATEHHQTTLKTKEQQHAETIKTIAKEVSTKTTTNFNNLFHAIEPGRIDMHSALTKNFFTYLGNSAPIVQLLTKGKGFAVPNNRPPRELATESGKSASTLSRRSKV